jgi:uncharacterized protein (TIGR03067 family)
MVLLPLWLFLSGCDDPPRAPVSAPHSINVTAKKERAKGNYTEMTLVYDKERFLDEYKRLDGIWMVDSLRHRGRHYSFQDLEDSDFPAIVIITHKPPINIDKRCDIYKVIIDPTTTPKRLTAVVTGGEIKGDQLLGIYQLDGQHLTLKLSELGATVFPKDFRAVPEDGVLYLLKLRLIR